MRPQRETISALQNERLTATVKRVYKKVPHYRDKMDAVSVKPENIKMIEDLYKLPLGYKQDLRDTYPYGEQGYSANFQIILTVRTILAPLKFRWKSALSA